MCACALLRVLVLAVLHLLLAHAWFLVLVLVLFHTCPHSVSCSWYYAYILSLVHSWIVLCNLPLSHSLSLSFKNALHYHTCPAGRSCSFGEWRQGADPALKQQTIYWHLWEDIVRPPLSVVLWCGVFWWFSYFFPLIWSLSIAYLFLNEITKNFIKWT